MLIFLALGPTYPLFASLFFAQDMYPLFPGTLKISRTTLTLTAMKHWAISSNHGVTLTYLKTLTL